MKNNHVGRASLLALACLSLLSSCAEMGGNALGAAGPIKALDPTYTLVLNPCFGGKEKYGYQYGKEGQTISALSRRRAAKATSSTAGPPPMTARAASASPPTS